MNPSATDRADEVAIAVALAGQVEPRTMSAVLRALNPPPEPRVPGRGGVDGRTREGKAWLGRHLQLTIAFAGLWEHGVVRSVRPGDGENPALFALNHGDVVAGALAAGWELTLVAGRFRLVSPGSGSFIQLGAGPGRRLFEEVAERPYERVLDERERTGR